MELEIGGKCKKWKRDREMRQTGRRQTDRQAQRQGKKRLFEKKKEKKTFYIKEERTDKQRRDSLYNRKQKRNRHTAESETERRDSL